MKSNAFSVELLLFGKYLVVRLLLPLVVLTCLVLGCDGSEEERLQQPKEEEGLPQAVDMLIDSLPGGVEADQARDSFMQVIQPFLYADPAYGPMRTIQERRSEWEPLFGSPSVFIRSITAEADRLLREEDLDAAAKVLQSAGKLSNLEGDLLGGTEINQKAYELAREVGDSSLMGWLSNQLSTSFIYSGDSASAVVYLEKAMSLAEATNNFGLKTAVLTRIGALNVYVGNPQGLLDYNEKALKLTREYGFVEQEKLALANIGYALNKLGKPQEAIRFLQKEFRQELVRRDAGNAFVQTVLFESYLALNNFEQAEKELTAACEISYELEYYFGIGYCKQGLASFYEKKRDWEEALHRFKDYHNHREQILSTDAQRGMRSLQLRQLEKENEWKISRLEQEREEQLLRQKSLRNRTLLWVLVGFFASAFTLSYLAATSKIRQERMSKEVAEVRLQFLRAQMNPHFMFNAINGIQNQILKSKKIEAYTYLGKFAELLRMITKSSASVLIDLEEEVQFLKTYLELEKLRFRDGFDYELIVDPGLLNSNLHIPSMMIQPFVENAIIHGLSLLQHKGLLVVELTEQAEGVKCIIRDNGRGRKAAGLRATEKAKSHLSISSGNMKERIEFLRTAGHENSGIQIRDIYDGNEAQGTEVTILLPFMDQDNVLI